MGARSLPKTTGQSLELETGSLEAGPASPTRAGSDKVASPRECEVGGGGGRQEPRAGRSQGQARTKATSRPRRGQSRMATFQ